MLHENEKLIFAKNINMGNPKYYDYGLVRLQKIVNNLSGNRMDAKTDLIKAFKTGNWLVDEELPDELQDVFNKIDTLVTKFQKDKINNGWTNSISVLDQETCEQLVSDIKSLFWRFDIYMKRQR